MKKISIYEGIGNTVLENILLFEKNELKEIITPKNPFNVTLVK
ncbi:hypothetical protein [Methanococcus vannielii]|nr:hypothetical protein [Methanococcus vannielii]